MTVGMWHVFGHRHCYQGAKKHEKRPRQRNRSQGHPEDLSFLPPDSCFPSGTLFSRVRPKAPLLISPYEQSLSAVFALFSETISL